MYLGKVRKYKHSILTPWELKELSMWSESSRHPPPPNRVNKYFWKFLDLLIFSTHQQIYFFITSLMLSSSSKFNLHKEIISYFWIQNTTENLLEITTFHILSSSMILRNYSIVKISKRGNNCLLMYFCVHCPGHSMYIQTICIPQI